VFTRKRNMPEWQTIVATLYRKHIDVVGVGKDGAQIIKDLL
jgi:hypothetical protein